MRCGYFHGVWIPARDMASPKGYGHLMGVDTTKDYGYSQWVLIALWGMDTTKKYEYSQWVVDSTMGYGYSHKGYGYPQGACILSQGVWI